MVGGSCKSNSVIAHIKLSVVRTNEDIAQDPDGSHWWRNVHAHEPRQTDLLAHLRDLHDVMLRLQGELHTTNSKVDIREVGDGGTIWKSGKWI